jgi:hypothetical protein
MDIWTRWNRVDAQPQASTFSQLSGALATIETDLIV